jgi:hypothetical protein
VDADSLSASLPGSNTEANATTELSVSETIATCSTGVTKQTSFSMFRQRRVVIRHHSFYVNGETISY